MMRRVFLVKIFLVPFASLMIKVSGVIIGNEFTPFEGLILRLASRKLRQKSRSNKKRILGFEVFSDPCSKKIELK